ncbi:response regulator transcription factor [Nocardioides dongxiaopingii]|uniref:response regulator transcription factor n=1 Tax=Nocardioides TaxID=1839 RepID=UPI0010C7668E|nr:MULTISPECIES: response regulator transcription factor [Nocardioides]QCW51969.1 response regulator transcription factor [Nocardioides sp. S-1144]
MARPLRIAIVNDYQIVVAGVAAVLHPFASRVEVVELDVKAPVRSAVDLVLYDSFGQPQGDAVPLDDMGAVAAGQVVIFSWNTDPRLVERAMAAGVAGYLSKSLSGGELVAALEAAHSGRRVVPKPDTEAADEFGRWPGDEHGLSAREAEVLALICQGLSNQEITERAFIGMNTVKTYIRTLYRKIGVESRTQAVLWGVEHGFEPVPARIVRHPRS